VSGGGGESVHEHILGVVADRGGEFLATTSEEEIFTAACATRTDSRSGAYTGSVSREELSCVLLDLRREGYLIFSLGGYYVSEKGESLLFARVTRIA
jgi:hypothetical protein